MKEMYVALSGAVARDQQMTMVANNLANVNTPGFKKELAIFRVRPAETDLKNIADYSMSKLDVRQAALYAATLDAHFDAVGNGTARTRIFLQHRPELGVSRIEHHYVFHLSRPGRCPIILAVFHQSMDLMSRLRTRLED